MKYETPRLVKVSVSSKDVFSTYCSPDITDIDANHDYVCESGSPEADKGFNWYECYTFENW